MKLQLHALLALVPAFALLSACGKNAEEDVASTSTQPAAAQESAANTAGTTTYFGEEEQSQNASN